MNNNIVQELQKRINEELAQREWPEIGTLEETNRGKFFAGFGAEYESWYYKGKTIGFETKPAFFPMYLSTAIEIWHEKDKMCRCDIIIMMEGNLRGDQIRKALLYITGEFSEDGKVISWKVE